MASDATSSSAAPPPEAHPLSVNISIVSPSVAVNAPLNFPGLPPSTTVAQLKERIRDGLDSRPSNEQQRLIHQGKLLNRENDTLLDVFGEQKLRDSDQIAVHLVIRDHSDHPPPSGQAAASHGQSPAPTPTTRTPNVPSTLNPQRTPHNLHQVHHVHHHQPFGRPPPMAAQPHPPFLNPALGIPAAANQTAAQLFAQQQQLLQQYRAQFNQRPIGTPGHQPRPSTGLHGVPEQAGNQQFPANHGQGTNSPRPDYQGHVREAIGPNGEVVRVMTNSAFIAPNGQVFPLNMQQGHAGTPAPGGPYSTNDVHNIMRNADANQATSMMTDAMQRSASGASLANLNLNSQRQPIQPPGVTVSRRPSSTVPSSRNATPDHTRVPSYGSASAPPQPQAALRPSTSNQPEVYILNSPQGPRALLINNQSDLYYTPAARFPIAPMVPPFNPLWNYLPPQPQPQSQPRSGPSTDNAGQPGQPQPAAAIVQQQAPQQGNVRVNILQEPAAQQQGRQQQQAQIRPIARGHINPEAGVAGALIAALWPHIWLMIRLGVFVWWFTSSDTSWTRWFAIMSVATAVFLMNTGLLNGIANNMFNPVRQHLEGLIPLGGPDPNRNRDGNGNNPHAGAQNGGNDNQAPRPGEPDPAQVAARLVAQRRHNNANWLLDQVRRLERAGLLFLASIAPGVAERHIAALEAQERAERERREAEERAERERREAAEREAAEATAAAVEGAVASVEGEHDGSPGSGPGEDEQQPAQQEPVAAS